jgi:hypothetical protein
LYFSAYKNDEKEMFDSKEMKKRQLKKHRKKKKTPYILAEMSQVSKKGYMLFSPR